MSDISSATTVVRTFVIYLPAVIRPANYNYSRAEVPDADAFQTFK